MIDAYLHERKAFVKAAQAPTETPWNTWDIVCAGVLGFLLAGILIAL